MKESATKFLALLDLVYLRGWGDKGDWDDYCLCNFPGTDRRPISWMEVKGSSDELFKEICSKSGISLNELAKAWMKYDGELQEAMNYPSVEVYVELRLSRNISMGYYRPWGNCIRRSEIMQILKLL